MKKVINGKRYDTHTAKLIGGIMRGAQGDLDYYYEDLYQKKTGEFFIHGIGGARTLYAKQLNGGWTGPGEKIIPISEEKAKDWVNDNFEPEIYNVIWGEEEK